VGQLKSTTKAKDYGLSGGRKDAAQTDSKFELDGEWQMKETLANSFFRINPPVAASNYSVLG
jgi:hypothetical protein